MAKSNYHNTSASELTLYYTSSQPGPSPSIPHQSWPTSTLNIMYYFNDVTFNIGCHRSCPISATTWRVSEECQRRVWIGGCRVWRGLWATFGGGVGWGVRVEGVGGSVGDCWKGLGIRSTLKCLQNLEVVRVWRMPKVSEVRVGKTLRTPRCFQSGKHVIP